MTPLRPLLHRVAEVKGATLSPVGGIQALHSAWAGVLLCWGVRGVLALFACCLVHAQATLQLQPGSAIATVAGSGKNGTVTAGSATSSALGSPRGMVYDAAGNLLVADARNNVVVKINTSGVLSVYAGSGRQGYAGDGGTATLAAFNGPSSLALDVAGNLYIADTGNHCIRKVTAAGVVTTIAGSGSPGNAGDGGLSTAAKLRRPNGLAIDANGNVYVADTGNHRVRMMTASGFMQAFAGTGAEGNDGDTGLALEATFQEPTGLARTTDGALLITDSAARRIRLVSAAGVIDAYSAPVRRPEGIATDASGSAYVADAGNQVVRQSSTDGASNAAGSGVQGAVAAGFPTNSPLDSPSAVAVGTNGDMIVSDRRNHQVQRVSLAKLSFANVAVGTTSAAQTVALHNAGTEPLQVLAVNLPASFIAADAGTTCVPAPFTLQAAAACSVAIAFAPLAQGVQAGTAQIRVMGAAPQAVLLTGTGTATGTTAASSIALTSNGSVSYAGQLITFNTAVSGTLSSTPTGTVTLYDGSAQLTMASLNGGAATMTTASMTQGQHTMHAVYSGDAIYAGSTSGTVTEAVIAAPDFSVTGAAASYSGNAGKAVTMGLMLTPINGTLNHAVTFTIAGLPSGATAAFLPATVVLGSNPVPVTLTAQMPTTLSLSRQSTWPLIAASLLISLALSKRRTIAVLCLLFPAACCLGGCGGFRGSATSASSSSSPFNYNAVVTATTTGVLGDALTHSVTIGLVVTQ